VVRAVEAGVISINTGCSVHMEMPFGGVKHSVGRELGQSALGYYSEQKSVFISDE
jgi:betaine-aldehyde dehydrogenase